MSVVRIALVQVDAGTDKARNVDTALSLVKKAAEEGARVVALPENFHVRAGAKRSDIKLQSAEPIPGPLSERLAEVARTNGIFFLAGSYGERVDGASRIYNTSLFFGPDGQLMGKYRKLHLFDVTIGDHVVAAESDLVTAGDEVVVADTEFARVGLSICYDVRFPELYRAHADCGATMSFVPANFTLFTGRDHWETLLRARAIENGMFMIAPAQIGRVPDSHQSYGRSMIVDPWGVVTVCASDQPGVTHGWVDTDLVEAVRAKIPSLEHRRQPAYRQPSRER
jgi:deaminated glutathione amidase